mmetsp:Transcript_22038/g.30384  ORF Transcript_22038/g.30384 Transcript_22038/m.30384 type:complete len:97 (-) Transcript_22038:235-525(-)
MIYTFGGYDAYDKVQVSTCEYYDMKKDTWHNSPALNPSGSVEFKLHKERSQSSASIFNDEQVFIFGGYHREDGTLNTIERFWMKEKRMEKLDLLIP